jgi:glycosyltransferase involved in cell wall biosynthesis
MNKHAAITIVSKNYMAFAETLANSYKKHHPNNDFFIVLVDRADGFVKERLACGAEVIEMADLDIPEISQFIYRYSIMELNTAVKPFALSSMFVRNEYDTLLYIDPDIRVYEPLTEVYSALEEASIVLTPHLRRPYNDGSNPSDLAILQSGTYNLGFIGLRRGKTSDELLAWWMEKLYRDCVVDLPKGLFVDQKWIDMIPGFFPDHRILYHPGYNAAYWNLHERPITRDGDRWLADNQRIAFFHFSGYVPYMPTVLSKHQNRHDLKSLPDLKALTDSYAKELFDNGYEESHAWPYAFAKLPNGVKLPLRLVAAAMQWCSRAGVKTPDPVLEPDAFCRFLMSRGKVTDFPNVVMLFHFLLSMRGDVRGAFPAAWHDSDDAGFRAWLRGSGEREEQLVDLLPFEEEGQIADHVGDVFLRIRSAGIDDVLEHFQDMWTSPKVFSQFVEWVRTEGVQELALDEAHASALERATTSIAKILHIFFLRGDLQARFNALQNATQVVELSHWLRQQRVALDLDDDGISLFVEFASASSDLIDRMRLLYQHSGSPSRAEPSVYAVDTRRNEIGSTLSAADCREWLSTGDAIPVADQYLRRFGASGPVLEDISQAFAPGLSASENFELAKKIRREVTALEKGGPVVNLAGYLQATSGMGESGRSMQKTLALAGFTSRCTTLPGISIEPAPIPTKPAFFGWPSAAAALSITVANADSLKALQEFLPGSHWTQSNVGYWVWETEELPKIRRDSQRAFDQIWTPSEYSAAAIRKTIDLPVHVLPHMLSTDLLDIARASRPRFGLPQDALLFGFSFDPLSSIERKNVRGLIAAFGRAFSAKENVYLILKVNGKAAGAFEYEQVRANCKSDRILFMDATLDRQSNFDFLASLDVYVSLHRSEGFGLTCAEAMALGLPVIATGYSGNVDFMSESNSVLVPTRVIETDRPFGPYPAGTRWGEPDVDAAAQAMRRMLDRSARGALGAAGRSSIRETLSPTRLAARARDLVEGALAETEALAEVGAEPRRRAIRGEAQ